MSRLPRIPVTEALKTPYGVLRALAGAGGLDWIVVRSNPRCERRALESLTAAGLIAFLPMLPATRKNSRSRKEVDTSRPLCPRYLFVALDRQRQQSTSDVVVCDGVEAVLSFHADRRPHLVPAPQMATVIEICFEALTATKYQKIQALEIGARIKILTGGFDGFEAVVTGYEAAKGTVKAKAGLFGGEVSVQVPVDKIKLCP